MPMLAVWVLQIFTVFMNFGDANTTVQGYLQIIFDLPFMGLIALIIVVSTFKKELSSFIKNATKVKVGPAEMESNSQLRKSADKPVSSGSISADRKMQELQAQVKKLSKKSSQKAGELSQKDEYIRVLEEKTKQLEFKYLDSYLVQRTKIVLAHIDSQEIISQNLLRADLRKSGIDEAEIEAVINALLTNELIEAQGELFKITSKGKEYVNYADLHQLIKNLPAQTPSPSVEPLK